MIKNEAPEEPFHPRDAGTPLGSQAGWCPCSPEGALTLRAAWPETPGEGREFLLEENRRSFCSAADFQHVWDGGAEKQPGGKNLGTGSLAGHQEQLSPMPPRPALPATSCTHWKLPSASAHSKPPGVTPGSGSERDNGRKP